MRNKNQKIYSPQRTELYVGWVCWEGPILNSSASADITLTLEARRVARLSMWLICWCESREKKGMQEKRRILPETGKVNEELGNCLDLTTLARKSQFKMRIVFPPQNYKTIPVIIWILVTFIFHFNLFCVHSLGR